MRFIIANDFLPGIYRAAGKYMVANSICNRFRHKLISNIINRKVLLGRIPLFLVAG